MTQLVRALKSFSGRIGQKSYHIKQGDVFPLPDGADWLTAGIVALVEDAPEPPAVPKRKPGRPPKGS